MTNQIRINRNQYVNIADIILMEGDSNYSRLSMSNGQIFYLAKTIKKLADGLNDELFFRTHKKYLINLNYFESYDEDNIYLKNNLMAMLSRRRKTSFRKAIK